MLLLYMSDYFSFEFIDKPINYMQIVRVKHNDIYRYLLTFTQLIINQTIHVSELLLLRLT